MSDSWWISIRGSQLGQGDMLPDCLLPVFYEAPHAQTNGEPVEEALCRGRLIVVTQSCDLENAKVDFVALCPVHSLAEFEQTNPEFAKKGRWENVRKGRVEGLHLLASIQQPEDNRQAWVVDFGQIVSIPLEYAQQHATSLGDRWRLAPPFLEHFSQAFARFFMRVGLPSTIPEYR